MMVAKPIERREPGIGAYAFDAMPPRLVIIALPRDGPVDGDVASGADLGDGVA